jgi:hypothetical protein
MQAQPIVSHASATESAPEAARSPARPSLALDDLLALEPAALERLYAEARVPPVDALRGDLRGRMLAVTVVPPGWSAAARIWAGSDAFPWRGKSFAPLGATEGRGINRVFNDRTRLFAFETSIGPSRAGDFDAFQLDYDLPENPFFIRRIKDEIREIGSGLYLGQAYWHTSRQDHLVLYFALASRS